MQEIQESKDQQKHADLLKILIIDDDSVDRDHYVRCLSADADNEYVIKECGDPIEGMSLYREEHFDCVLLDYMLPTMDGLDVLKALVGNEPEDKPPIIMLTGQGSESLAVCVFTMGASDYLPKHRVSTESLKRAILNAVENFRLRTALAGKRRSLETKNRKLQSRNEEIQRFYQTVSHEIKTPLTSIREFVALVHEGIAGDLNDQQREFLGYALESCDLMAAEVNDLIDVTRLETGRLKLELNESSITETVEQSVRTVSALAKKGSIVLKTDIPKSVPLVRMDQRRVIQVITNLLSNAIKFTEPAGNVAVRVELGHSGLQICIEDSGCGISDTHIERVFERLYQVPIEENGGQVVGLGLGLAISNEIVKLHGGTLNVKSELNRGSEFSFNLPIS
ncbi:MAG: hybrid sensor histidine kinase/response regulator [Pseudomonadales bacterium]|nr:hybrid sensor histidine kinase/response regulator [Pseudomonadales bacterium]